ncbi:MAG: thioesterase family protein, partial [Actinomycetota bacterium]|nr:thioesterase family protein [Actinomycetota bacterium]
LLRCLPAQGWLRVVQRAKLLHGGWLDEECEVWDSSGQLVAQARQLAGYREPDQLAD